MGITKSGYRPDVDGLRGIAILLGVGFHYFPESMPGGYIAVDSFFVISGFLITSIIRDGILAGNFSFIDFYSRRIKRLFPSLLVVLIFTYLVAWAGATADEFQEISNHILSGSFFYANFTMANEVDYFAKAAEYKPLLTLWSLSVEEQFYFLWPALFIGFRKFRFNLKIVTGLMLAIFFYVAFRVYPQFPEESYFYPHVRFWELLAGCFFALTVRENNLLSAKWKNILSVSAFIMMVTSFFTITRPDPVQLILPVAATVFFILAGKDAWINRKFLSFPPLVTVGLISYCVYLWHWPLLSFVRIVFGYEPDVLEKFGLIALTLVVSYLCYYYLEIPSRRSRRKIVPLGLLASVSLVGFLGYITNTTELIPPRPRIRKSAGRLALFDKKLQQNPFFTNYLFLESRKAVRIDKCHYRPKSGPIESYLPNLDKCLITKPGLPRIAIIGDSYAADLYASFARTHSQYNFLQMTGAGCAFKRFENFDCDKLLEHAFSYVESNQVDAVILASRWDESFPAVKPFIDRLQKANRKVIITGPPLEFNDVIRNVIEKRWAYEDLPTLVKHYLRKEAFELNRRVKAFTEKAGADYIDRMSLACESEEYCEILSETGDLLIMDTTHLTLEGIDALGNKMLDEKILETILKK